MKLTGHLALSLLVIVLLAVGAIGFADKTEEQLKRGNTPVETQAQTNDNSPDEPQNEHSKHQQPSGAQLHNHDLNNHDSARGPSGQSGTANG